MECEMNEWMNESVGVFYQLLYCISVPCYPIADRCGVEWQTIDNERTASYRRHRTVLCTSVKYTVCGHLLTMVNDEHHIFSSLKIWSWFIKRFHLHRSCCVKCKNGSKLWIGKVEKVHGHSESTLSSSLWMAWKPIGMTSGQRTESGTC